ncbi:MAG: type I-E CRISPR-associated protein Cse2/CasB [Limisphaerales bacterium]
MSNPQTTPKERAARFVGRLRGIGHDRGKLAALRRGLSPSTVMDAWPVVASLGGDLGQPGQSVFVDLAALFASHPEESHARSFGETCRAIARADSSDRTLPESFELSGDGALVGFVYDSSDRTLPESFERRFRRLLACGDVADLSGQLRSWIRLAAGKGVGVNYEGLFADLWNWRLFADDIRVKWARSFWQSGEAAVPETANPATA